MHELFTAVKTSMSCMLNDGCNAILSDFRLASNYHSDYSALYGTVLRLRYLRPNYAETSRSCHARFKVVTPTQPRPNSPAQTQKGVPIGIHPLLIA